MTKIKIPVVKGAIIKIANKMFLKPIFSWFICWLNIATKTAII